ncbi:MAG: bifunctional helix-turn-helix domain-containing protein/methylated-DNA--[protein]-cysteine S-methyltransferase [Pseudomonadota bacterium]
MNTQHSYHYHVIRRALEHIDGADGPISLDALAAEFGYSTAHFQRTFTQWAGVSPKRYQQYLTLDHAKTLLRDNFTTLETAHAVGLSGSSRLHDLFLKWEAMAPGSYAKSGDGLTLRWGWFDSPFGEALAVATERGICGLGFVAEMGRDAAMNDMTARWPAAKFVKDPAALDAWITALFQFKGTATLDLIGTPLQLKVWQALMNIPSGQVTTYSEIAQRIGQPKAVRAIGTAVGRTPISWCIPCHRALRNSGGGGGYHWGLPIKRALLAYETAQADPR